MTSISIKRLQVRIAESGETADPSCLLSTMSGQVDFYNLRTAIVWPRYLDCLGSSKLKGLRTSQQIFTGHKAYIGLMYMYSQ